MLKDAYLYCLKVNYKGNIEEERIKIGNCVSRNQSFWVSTMPGASSHMTAIYKRCQNLWEKESKLEDFV